MSRKLIIAAVIAVCAAAVAPTALAARGVSPDDRPGPRGAGVASTTGVREQPRSAVYPDDRPGPRGVGGGTAVTMVGVWTDGAVLPDPGPAPALGNRVDGAPALPAGDARVDDWFRDATPVAVTQPIAEGFDWRDFGMGAASVLGALMLGAAFKGIALTARRANTNRTLGRT